MKTALLVLLLHAAAVPEPWSWSQAVEYQEYHDPSMVSLRDGRKLQVDFSTISWETVNKWPAGKALHLVYDAQSGPRLVDPETNKSLPVLAGLEKHPIDFALDACLEKKYSTQEMIECYDEARTRWDQELNRAYRVLLEPLNEQARKNVQDAQRAWLNFRDAQFSALSAVYSTRDGTIWPIVDARRAMEVVREQALRLAGFQSW